MGAGWRGLIREYWDRLPVSDETPVVTLLEGREPDEALARACAAGAFAASRLGAQPSLTTAADVDALLARA